MFKWWWRTSIISFVMFKQCFNAKSWSFLMFYYCVGVLVFIKFVLAICLSKFIVGGYHINIQMWMQRSVSKYKKTWNQQHQKPHILEKDNDIFYHPLCFTKYGLIILSQYTSRDTNWLCISLPLSTQNSIILLNNNILYPWFHQPLCNAFHNILP